MVPSPGPSPPCSLPPCRAPWPLAAPALQPPDLLCSEAPHALLPRALQISRVFLVTSVPCLQGHHLAPSPLRCSGSPSQWRRPCSAPDSNLGTPASCPASPTFLPWPLSFFSLHCAEFNLPQKSPRWCLPGSTSSVEHLLVIKAWAAGGFGMQQCLARVYKEKENYVLKSKYKFLKEKKCAWKALS